MMHILASVYYKLFLDLCQDDYDDDKKKGWGNDDDDDDDDDVDG